MSSEAGETTNHNDINGQNRLNRIHNWAFRSTLHDNAYIRLCRIVVRVLTIMTLEAMRAKVTIRASALTYSIILAMVPMLALSTAILKGIGSGGQLRLAAERVIDQVVPANTYTSPTDENDSIEGKTLSDHLHEAVDTIFNYVDNTNFAALGVFGVIGFLVVAIGVFSAVEDAMNSIWRAHRGRSLFRKIMDYVALLILLPLSINTAFAGEAILASDKILKHLHTVIPIPWLLKMLLSLLPFLFIVLSLMAMYLFFSRARVTTAAALSGALFAAIFWFIVQKIYIFLQVGVANYNAIYGSFATVPLFLIWMHLGWIIILLGATLAYAVQNQKHYMTHEEKLSPQRQLQLAYDVLNATFHRHVKRLPATAEHLASDIPWAFLTEVEWIAQHLVEGNLLRVASVNDEDNFLPVTVAKQLNPGEVIDIVLGAEQNTSPGAHLSELALQGAKKAVNQHSFPLTSL
ncbi:YihY/virulence factor BrkB family protein [Desulfogranum japonicum]|uniref:YihY/virulence factor BrkB family protein n=1 Tax=Desulfogranum japonicum TaxID=231447 RepID=UPI0004013D92|nr:YihY/virulence factor BrkB family protein [Desulfogranum japonicum]